MKRIMFNDQFGLTKAVLEGRKTMTRRIITNETALAHCKTGNFDVWNYASYFAGELVAIAQSYKDVNYKFPYGPEKVSKLINTPGWNNKMCVKANLMPHHIRIKYVGVERLQYISWNDCLREGLKEVAEGFVVGDMVFHNPKHAYEALIDKISKIGTWDSNPWVFVYDFELVD